MLGVKILIVDDVSFMRTMLRNIFTNADFEVVGEAENGIKAVEKYKELRSDLVTLDITMPEMDGICAIKEIKAFDPNAKIVMCSAMGQHFMVVEAIQAGAKDFIVKPFEAVKAVEAINKALN